MFSQAAGPAEAGSIRENKVLPARVWQPNELLMPTMPPEGFVVQAWRNVKNPAFELTKYTATQVLLLSADPTVRPDSPDSPGSPGSPESAANPSHTSPSLEFTPATSTDNGHNDEDLQQAQAQGYARGVEETRLQLRSEIEAQLRAEQEADQTLVQALQNAVTELQQNPLTFFEPLKRLALHLAEQLVLGELQLNAEAIDRLVQRCVDALAAPTSAMILVQLNPNDMAQLEALQKSSGVTADASFRLVANPSLPIGSVRASADDAVVEDLIKHRLSDFARDMALEHTQFQSDSRFAETRTADV